MKNIFVIFSLIFSTLIFSQEKKSRIIIYALPLNLETNTSLDVEDIKEFSDEFKKVIILDDSSSISEFDELDLLNEDKVLNDDTENTSVRIVIEIYRNGMVQIIILDKYLAYCHDKKYYGINIALKKWLKKNNCIN